MNLAERLKEAQERRDAWREEQEQAERQRLSALLYDCQQHMIHHFGEDVCSALDLQPTLTDTGAWTRLHYQGRAYSLFDADYHWRLMRLDGRGPEDSRQLPSTTFTAHWREEYREQNIDALLLSLAELHAMPEEPPPPPPAEDEHQPIAARRVMTHREAALLDALSDWIENG